MKKQLLALGMVAALGAPQAYAANSDALTKNGSGDVIVVMRNFDNTESLFWDLSLGGNDLTASDFYNGQGSFVTSNAAVDAWVGANIGLGALTFNIFGLSNELAFDPNPFPPNPGHPNVGGVVTVANLTLQDSGSQTSGSVNGLQSFIGDLNGAGFPDNGVLVTNDPVGNAFFGGAAHDANLFGTAASTAINAGAIDFFYIQMDPALTGANDGAAQAAAPPVATLLGEFNFTFSGGIASLAFNAASAAPVPLPAGVWLLGSALVGLVGIRRRA